MAECPWCGNTTGHEPLCLGGHTVEPPRPAPPVLDLEEGKRRRDAGMAAAAAHADPTWKGDAATLLAFTAARQATVTADDLYAAGMVVPEGCANALGAIFTAAARAGLIENTHRTVRSQRPSSHARAIPVWRSLVWERAQARGVA